LSLAPCNPRDIGTIPSVINVSLAVLAVSVSWKIPGPRGDV
jgi:hypothetical protein